MSCGTTLQQMRPISSTNGGPKERAGHVIGADFGETIMGLQGLSHQAAIQAQVPPLGYPP